MKLLFTNIPRCIWNVVQISPNDFRENLREKPEKFGKLIWGTYPAFVFNLPTLETSLKILAWFFIIQQKFIELKKTDFPYFFTFFSYEKIFLRGVKIKHNKKPKKTGETQYTEKKTSTMWYEKKNETFITFELEGINHFSAMSFGKKGEKNYINFPSSCWENIL